MTLHDDDLGISTRTAQVLIDGPPTVDAGGPYDGVEGFGSSLVGTSVDPENDPLTTAWTFYAERARPRRDLHQHGRHHAPSERHVHRRRDGCRLPQRDRQHQRSRALFDHAHCRQRSAGAGRALSLARTDADRESRVDRRSVHGLRYERHPHRDRELGRSDDVRGEHRGIERIRGAERLARVREPGDLHDHRVAHRRRPRHRRRHDHGAGELTADGRRYERLHGAGRDPALARGDRLRPRRRSARGQLDLQLDRRPRNPVQRNGDLGPHARPHVQRRRDRDRSGHRVRRRQPSLHRTRRRCASRTWRPSHRRSAPRRTRRQTAARSAVSVGFTDQGTHDTHTASISWGDSSATPGTVAESAGSGSVTGSHTYAGSGTYHVVVTITDDNDGVATVATDVVVNGAPQVDAGGPYSGFEGTPVALERHRDRPGSRRPRHRVDASRLRPTPGRVCTPTGTATLTPTLTCTDDATVVATLTVKDTVNPPVVDTATISIGNRAPTVTPAAGIRLARARRAPPCPSDSPSATRVSTTPTPRPSTGVTRPRHRRRSPSPRVRAP